MSHEHVIEEKTMTHECFCGADIRLTTGTEDVWVGLGGTRLCYPGSPGEDGEARHEPCEELEEPR